MTEKKLFI